MTDPYELLAECADALELADRRADYWRRVACELASGEREPYPLPSEAYHRLQDAAPSWARWAPAATPDVALNNGRRRAWWR